MKCTYSQIKYLGYLRVHGHSCNAYKVISREPVIKMISKPVPHTAGWSCNCDEDGFPLYLAGCKDYYDRPAHKWQSFQLKPEYEDNRPTYSVRIAYEVLDIELTAEGKAEVERRYNIHKRNMEKYAKLLG